MTSARSRLTGLAACVVGAALALLSSSQVWVRAVVAEQGLPRVVVEPTGRDLAPVVAALGLVGLAGAVALLASRGRARLAAAVVLVLTGAGVTVGALLTAVDLRGAAGPDVAEAVGRTDAPLDMLDATAWPWLAVAAGVLLVVGGVLAALAPGGSGLAARYDADVAGRRETGPEPGAGVDLDDDDAVWKALDRGDDPTTR